MLHCSTNVGKVVEECPVVVRESVGGMAKPIDESFFHEHVNAWDVEDVIGV